MVDKLIVRALYEDGVFKPLQPVDLPDQQIVEFELEVDSSEDDNLDFRGILAPYWEEMSYEDMEQILATEKQKWLYRLMRQIEGDFESHEDTE
jgi:predicted DNA-binding antitoxin AbrB/MazE fold protein